MTHEKLSDAVQRYADYLDSIGVKPASDEAMQRFRDMMAIENAKLDADKPRPIEPNTDYDYDE